jgi:hypothetical protein
MEKAFLLQLWEGVQEGKVFVTSICMRCVDVAMIDYTNK